MNTRSFKKSDIQETWILLDAKGKTLGRFATEVANILTGKNKPEYTPNADMGDYVIVVNANYINVTGKKLEIRGIEKSSLDKIQFENKKVRMLLPLPECPTIATKLPASTEKLISESTSGAFS